MFKITGFDDVKKHLKQLQENANELAQTKSIPLSDLFTESFMEKYTNCSSFEEFLEIGGFEVNSKEDFENIDDAEFDKHVSNNSQFDTWQLMLDTAAEQYITKKLGF